MTRFPFLIVCFFLVSMSATLSAQRDLNRFSSQDIRLAALELFDQLAVSTPTSSPLYPYLEAFNRDAFQADSIAFDQFAALLTEEDGVAKMADTQRADQDQVAVAVLRIYQMLNGDLDMVAATGEDTPVSRAVFFSLVDRLDGVLDGRLDAPDLDSYYQLWVNQSVPPAALCFDCRLDERWGDRRRLINPAGLNKLLPRRLHRQMAGSDDADVKVAALARFVRDSVVYLDEHYNEDFWQTPFETLTTGSGDAEDMAILFQAVAELYALPTKIVVGTLFLAGDQPAAVRNHSWVAYEGQVLDLTSFVDKHEDARYEPKLVLDSKNGWFMSARR